MSDTACCEHDVIWHHERRGCGYHGFSEDRCPCLLTADEAVAERIAEAVDAALTEAADRIGAWIRRNYNGDGLTGGAEAAHRVIEGLRDERRGT